MSAVVQIAEREPFPLARHKRLYVKRPIRIRDETDQSRYDQIAKCRMVVVLSSLLRKSLLHFGSVENDRSRYPVAGEGIHVFVNPRHDDAVLTRAPMLTRILRKQFRKCSFRQPLRSVALQMASERRKRN